MKSHQIDGRADWEHVAPGDRTLWQRVAARTGGWVTPGNAVTMAGALLLASGLRDVSQGKYGRGLVKMGVAGFADRLDGGVADMTQTKCPTGEMLDTAVDKGSMVASLAVMTKAGLVAPGTAAMLGAESAVNVGLAAEAKRHGNTLHPGWLAKVNMGLQRSVVGLPLLAAVARERGNEKAARSLEGASMVALGGTVLLSAVVAKQYWQEARAGQVPAPEPEPEPEAISFEPDLSLDDERAA